MVPIHKTVEIKSGFYPSIVYLPVPPQIKQLAPVQQIKHILQQNSVHFQQVQELHISLTKTFHPIISQIKHISAKIKQSIANSQIKLPVALLLNKIIAIDNFIAIQVQQITHQRLLPITTCLQNIVKQQFYQKPIFHVSLFKILAQMPNEVLEQIAQLQIKQRRCYSLNKCLMKSGKSIYTIN